MYEQTNIPKIQIFLFDRGSEKSLHPCWSQIQSQGLCLLCVKCHSWPVESWQNAAGYIWMMNKSLKLVALFWLRFDFSSPRHSMASCQLDFRQSCNSFLVRIMSGTRNCKGFIFGQLDLLIQVICFSTSTPILGAIRQELCKAFSSIKGIGQAPNLSSGRRRFAQSKDCVHLVLGADNQKERWVIDYPPWLEYTIIRIPIKRQVYPPWN